ncbi:MAG: AAA family ATPase, partial [Methylacidiphilaceae bacterium]|nr:AAA family ATPase [Candidatus Methylacidiphilaceae bacterium]
FRNTIIIMTSNIGSIYLTEGIGSSGEIPEAVRSRVMDELRAHFRPEFLNRLDEIVLFKPLQLPQLQKIVDLQLEELRKRLAERSITLELSDAAKQHLAQVGYSPVYGARPLKRVIQKELETPLSRKIVAGEIAEGTALSVDFSDGQIVFRAIPEAAA